MRMKNRGRACLTVAVALAAGPVQSALLLPTGNAFEPYRHVEECPEGMEPVPSDWPNPGDQVCRAPIGGDVGSGDGGAGISATSGNAPTGGNAATGGNNGGNAAIGGGNGGNAPVGANGGTGDDAAPGNTPTGGQGRLVLTTNNAFEPYRYVEECPDGMRPVTSDWPQPGDRVCVPEAAGGASLSGPVNGVPVCPDGSQPIPTNNAFQPYVCSSAASGSASSGKPSCPPGSHPQATNNAFQPYACVADSPAPRRPRTSGGQGIRPASERPGELQPTQGFQSLLESD